MFAGRGRTWNARALAPQAGPVCAALDLGTNNCRLLVARPAEGHGFQVIDAFSRIVRLGERLAATGELGLAAMDRAIDALRVCAAKVRRCSVTYFRGVATEACRRAHNGGAFLARVAAETGLELEAIDPREEAGLALAGCTPLLHSDRPHAVLFDIGGGSTEVTWLERGAHVDWRIIDTVSLGCGVVPFAERFGGDVVPVASYAAMVEETAGMLRPFDARHGIGAKVGNGGVQMLGTSGTVTTLAGVRMQLARYERSVVDGTFLDFADILATSRDLSALDWAGRARQPCIGPERADLVVAGCAILEAICRLWPVGVLRVADRGLREGMLLALMHRAASEGQEAAGTPIAPPGRR
ncbi:MAG: Ppx/GppA phosphatase family protein [Pseudomonadota bacterium]